MSFFYVEDWWILRFIIISVVSRSLQTNEGMTMRNGQTKDASNELLAACHCLVSRCLIRIGSGNYFRKHSNQTWKSLYCDILSNMILASVHYNLCVYVLQQEAFSCNKHSVVTLNENCYVKWLLSSHQVRSLLNVYIFIGFALRGMVVIISFDLWKGPHLDHLMIESSL